MAIRLVTVGAVAFALSGCVLAVGNTQAPVAPVMVSAVPGPQYQWLHGSGEAAILARRTFESMFAHVVIEQSKRGERINGPLSMVLRPGATPDAPHTMSCNAKPPAVIFDIDETALLNTGANYDSAKRGNPPFDPARWAEWERTGADKVEPMPGLVPMMAHLRESGVRVFFISNREKQFAAQAAIALKGAGLGEAVPGDTLLLKGDIAPGSGKDPRRQWVARRYCVLAMVGDQMGDFSDAYNQPGRTVRERRAMVENAEYSGFVGRGLFLLANPLYGPGVTGTDDDLFPADKRWTPEETH